MKVVKIRHQDGGWVRIVTASNAQAFVLKRAYGG